MAQVRGQRGALQELHRDPFPLGELEPGQLIRSMPWPEERKQTLLSGSALGWLGLGREHFM